METQVRTPQMVFTQPQRLIVPLFQRPYVWNQDNQWEPLWNDVIRVADRLLNRPNDKHQPHFLGAVVLQQAQNPIGQLQQHTIIDGQQRLTTLQLMLSALRAELVALSAIQPAQRIEPLVENAAAFRSHPDDRFKVWPTNRDRRAFRTVMGGDPSMADHTESNPNERIAHAVRFFGEEARKWIGSDGIDSIIRAEAIEKIVRDYLQMVVIDLGVDENAQEIFETLNARGAQLTAADLIKNFIFQRLLEAETDVEKAYQEHWKEFETGFWETEVSVGRLRYPRSSIFLNHWLIARTGEEIVAREVFSRFKRFAGHDSGLTMTELLEQIHSAASVYESFVRGSTDASASIDRLGLFGYRTSVLESEVIKPLVLYLRDPEQPPIPEAQLEKALDAVESWLVRRMLVRATTKSYTAVIAEMIRQLRATNRSLAGDLVVKYLAGLTAESGYWPDDDEVRGDMDSLLAYKRLRRGRLRMVLEAIEDHLRGWSGGKAGLGGQRVARDAYAIEHIMPRRWGQHWPLDDTIDAAGRDRIVDTLGNLTLLTSGHNSKVSNGPWLGAGGKRELLHQHNILMLNRKLLETVGDRWSEEAIRQRTRELTEIIIRIWPVPEGHKSAFAAEKTRIRKKISVDDLISGGVLEPGMRLYARRKAFSDRVITLLPDGRIEVDGVACTSPSDAAAGMTGKPTNGWWFLLVDQASRRSLRDVRSDYINEMAVDAEEDEDDEEE